MSGVHGMSVGRMFSGTQVSWEPSQEQRPFLAQPEQRHSGQETRSNTKEADLDQLVQQVEQANRFFLNHHTHLEFSIHKETKAIIVRIVDSETQEVLKEIPPEKLLDLVAKLWEMAGLLIDERR